jgi:hypothetical protein
MPLRGRPRWRSETEPTTIEVGYLNSKKKEYAIEERPTTGTLYATFTCGVELVEWRGASIASITPALRTIHEGESLSFKPLQHAGFQGGSEVVMEEQVNGGGFHPIAFEDEGVISPVEAQIAIKGSASGKKPAVFQIKTKKKKM